MGRGGEGRGGEGREGRNEKRAKLNEHFSVTTDVKPSVCVLVCVVQCFQFTDHCHPHKDSSMAPKS